MRFSNAHKRQFRVDVIEITTFTAQGELSILTLELFLKNLDKYFEQFST